MSDTITSLHLLLIATLGTIVLTGETTHGDTVYTCEVLARTGDLGITALQPYPSINDSGFVAFTAAYENPELGVVSDNLFVWDPRDRVLRKLCKDFFALRNTGGGPQQTMSPYPQINNLNQVIVRRWLTPLVWLFSPISTPYELTLTYLEEWDATVQMPFSDEGGTLHRPQQFAMGEGQLGQYAWAVVLFNPVWAWHNPSQPNASDLLTPFVANSPCMIIQWAVSLNSSGKLVFVRVGSDFNNYLASPVQPPNSYNFLFLSGNSWPDLRPALADNDTFVVAPKDGNGRRLQLYSYDMSLIANIAALPVFSVIGVAPGITNDGNAVAFCGQDNQGVGMFIATAAGGWVPLRIAGVSGNGILDPGEDYEDLNGNEVFDSGLEADNGSFTGFALDSPVGVRSPTEGEHDYVVVFAGVGSSGESGIYTIDVTPDNPIGPLTGIGTVLETGSRLEGLSGRIAALSLHDAINSGGEITFGVNTDTGQMAIVKAVPDRIRVREIVVKESIPIQTSSEPGAGIEADGPAVNIPIYDHTRPNVHLSMADHLAIRGPTARGLTLRVTTDGQTYERLRLEWEARQVLDEDFTLGEIISTGRKDQVRDGTQSQFVLPPVKDAIGAFQLKLRLHFCDATGRDVTRPWQGDHLLYQTLYEPILLAPLPISPEVCLKKATIMVAHADNPNDELEALDALNQGLRYEAFRRQWKWSNSTRSECPYDASASNHLNLLYGPTQRTNCGGFARSLDHLATTLGIPVTEARFPPRGREFDGLLTIQPNVEAIDGQLGNAHKEGQVLPDDRFFFLVHYGVEYSNSSETWFFDPSFTRRFQDPTTVFDYTKSVLVLEYFRHTSGKGYIIWLDWLGPSCEHPNGRHSYIPPSTAERGYTATEQLVSEVLPQESGPVGSARFVASPLIAATDTDADGVFEALTASFQIEGNAGNYAVSGNVSSGDLHITSRSGESDSLPTVERVAIPGDGPVEASIAFSGEDIFQSGADESVTMYVYLLSEEGTLQDNVEIDVGSVDHRAFGEVDLRLGGSNESLYDQNGNGLAEWLTAQIVVNATKTANCTILAVLGTSDGQVLETREVAAALTAPHGVVVTQFDGASIRGAGKDGPFRVSIRLYNSDGVFLDSHDYLTEPYPASTFEEPPVSFRGAYSDHGVDLNGNGRYDQLRVDAELEVVKGGSYELYGWLYDAAGVLIDIATMSSDLSNGMATVSFAFDGGAIWEHGMDGPYHLNYVAAHERRLDTNGYLCSITDAFMTANYSFWEFEPPRVGAVVLADLDGDGDVDADDFARFQACASGPAIPHDGSATCRRVDFDQDMDVDLEDFAITQRCFSGADRPADPDCGT